MSFDNSKVQALINKIKSQILGDIEDEIEEHNVVANSSRTGHVQAGSSPQDINTSQTSNAGTDNGYYARADHVHKIAIASTTGKGIVQLDSTPTANSSNGVTSHGIKTALNEVMNGTNVGTFAELQTLITDASSGDTIILDKDYKNAGSENRITINKPLTIIGNGHVIDADEKSSIFYISSEGNGCKINGLIFMNGKSDNDGSAISCTSSNTISDCSFTNNTTTNAGGAILCSSSNNISNCSFTNNSAYNGGAINYSSSNNNISDCNFNGNTATNKGGAINGGSSTISDCSFINNTAINGGAINCLAFNSISNCSFINNIATTNGGAIICTSSNTISNCSFINNIATSNGGAIRCSHSDNSISDCSFNGNTASNGVHIYNSNSTSLIIYNCHINAGLYNTVNYDDVNSSGLLDLIYPIGSIYLDAGNHSVCPIQTLLGGTWSRIEDRFLLASGSTYTATYDSNGFANKTAGSANAVVVEHNHEQNAHTHTQNAHTHTQDAHTHTQDEHTHTQNSHTHGTGSTTYPNFYTGSIGLNATASKKAHTNSNSGVYLIYSDNTAQIDERSATGSATPTINSTTATNQTTIATNQSTTATNQSTTATNKSSGESGVGKNMPPYLVVNVWKRTA